MELKVKIALLSLLSIYSLASVAEFQLQPSNTEKLFVSSETAEINRQSGIGVYVTDVTIDQGDTHVTGDKATTHDDETGKLKEVIIESSSKQLAHYRTLVEEGKPELHAKAKTIKYYPQKNYIVLIGTASIVQGEDTIRGTQLEYDINKQVLKSHQQAKNGNPPSRTTIVIDPNQSKKPS